MSTSSFEGELHIATHQWPEAVAYVPMEEDDRMQIPDLVKLETSLGEVQLINVDGFTARGIQQAIEILENPDARIAKAA